MKPQDQALLVMVSTALVTAVAVLTYRRRRGSSRPLATFAAGMAFGAVASIAMLVFTDALLRPRAGIGLEKIVAPIVTMFSCTIGATILALLVHLFEHGGSRRGLQTISVEADSILTASLRDTPPRGAAPQPPATDWRSVARDAGASKDRR